MSIRQLVESMLKKINQQIDRLRLQLETLNEGWKLIDTEHTISPELSQNLTSLYHEWTFFERWRGQLSERLLEMTV
jgi:flagellin-specific chaperone FliS